MTAPCLCPPCLTDLCAGAWRTRACSDHFCDEYSEPATVRTMDGTSGAMRPLFAETAPPEVYVFEMSAQAYQANAAELGLAWEAQALTARASGALALALARITGGDFIISHEDAMERLDDGASVDAPARLDAIDETDALYWQAAEAAHFAGGGWDAPEDLDLMPLVDWDD